jgi:hypothetical protein
MLVFFLLVENFGIDSDIKTSPLSFKGLGQCRDCIRGKSSLDVLMLTKSRGSPVARQFPTTMRPHATRFKTFCEFLANLGHWNRFDCHP